MRNKSGLIFQNTYTPTYVHLETCIIIRITVDLLIITGFRGIEWM